MERQKSGRDSLEVITEPGSGKGKEKYSILCLLFLLPLPLPSNLPELKSRFRLLLLLKAQSKPIQLLILPDPIQLLRFLMALPWLRTGILFLCYDASPSL